MKTNPNNLKILLNLILMPFFNCLKFKRLFQNL